jgi:hypothetical protein
MSQEEFSKVAGSENWIFKLNELKKDKSTPSTQISRSYEDDRL